MENQTVAFPFFVQCLLRNGKWTGKHVIQEFLKIIDFKSFLASLASEYQTTEASLEVDLEFVYLLCKFDFDFAKEILLRSKYRQLPDGEVKLLRFLYTRDRESSFRVLVLEHHFNVNSAADLDFSDTALLEKLFRSGNYLD